MRLGSMGREWLKTGNPDAGMTMTAHSDGKQTVCAFPSYYVKGGAVLSFTDVTDDGVTGDDGYTVWLDAYACRILAAFLSDILRPALAEDDREEG
jgi:hypothetical protein